MLESKVFIGISKDYLKEIAPIPKNLYTLFVNHQEAYLHEVKHGKETVIGKFAPPYATLDQIEQLLPNISSLIGKLSDQYQIPPQSLKLYVIVESDG